jgi:hypothetical protein
MNKKILISGCSFTAGDNSWATYLEGDVHVQAHSAGSNGLISRTLVNKVHTELKNKSKDELFVIAQWTFINRYEFLMTLKENPNYNLLLEGYPFKKMPLRMEFENPTNFLDKDVSESSWFKSGGGQHNWQYDNNGDDRKYFNKWLSNFYENYWSWEYGWVNSLEHFLRLEHYLKSVGVEYKFFLSFGDGSDPNGYSVSDGGLMFTEKHRNFENGKHLFEMIDWDKWWLHKGKNHSYGGMVEWINERFDTDVFDYNGREDSHPTEEEHRVFTKEVVSKWI